MGQAFELTMRALAGDRSRAGRVAGVIAVVAAACWGAWMMIARVPIYRSSEHARLEVLPAPSRAASTVAGRVTAVHLSVGRRVAAGDVLVELDAASEKIALDKARGQAAAFDPEIASLEKEIAAEGNATSAEGASGRSAVREQVARLRAADSDLSHAEDELARVDSLAKAGVSPTADVDRAKAEVVQKREAREALGHSVDSLAAAEEARGAGRHARTAELQRQLAEVSGSAAAAKAEIARLELEIDRRTVRAPVVGSLGAIATLQPGAVVAAGDFVAMVVPDGKLQVVAEYGPTAIGRLAPGQPARVRLDGFPWTRFGSVPARVTGVANEVRDNTIRVELAIEAGTPPTTIPLAHGMTGTVDVEVEQASPGVLVLRSLVERRDDP